MEKSSTIKHIGVVKNVCGNQVEISIKNQSACSACHAKSTCGMSETVTKSVFAQLPHFALNEGDVVSVEASLKQSYMAVVIAYIIPVFLIVGVLVIASIFGVSDVAAAIYAIVMLVPYFVLLYLFRNKIGKRITFTITESNKSL